MIIGNTFEETAYHEAGHIVAAAVLGLALRPAGITIVEVEDTQLGGAVKKCPTRHEEWAWMLRKRAYAMTSGGESAKPRK